MRSPVAGLIVALFFGVWPGRGETVLDVTHFGARGDARELVVSTVDNSSVITARPPGRFTSADVGKVMCLFAAGRMAELSNEGYFKGNYGGTPTNHQDMVVTIVSVKDGNRATLSAACGVTTNNIRCIYGTQNREAFQECIAAAPNPCTIHIPKGRYLLIPPTALDSKFVQSNQFDWYSTITISKGGIHFLGDGTNETELIGNGAWQQKGYDEAYRGALFSFHAPVTDDGPLIFDNIQFNGNAVRNHGPYSYWPAVPTDGSGWDVTHHAMIEEGAGPGHAFKSITNCLFIHWRGETLIGLMSFWDGFDDVGNCAFIDGNATVFNFTFTHHYHHNLISDYYQAEEFYQGYCSNTCVFEDNIVTNIYNAAIAVTGALTNRTMAAYVISHNHFFLGQGVHGIETEPAQNVSIVNNHFQGGIGAVFLGAGGVQGNAINKNILVAGNFFSNCSNPIITAGNGDNRVEDVLVKRNEAVGGRWFAQQNGWCSNVVFLANKAERFDEGGLDSRFAAGQFYIDQPSSDLPPFALWDYDGKTNFITYAFGLRQKLIASRTNSVWIFDDTHSHQIPNGAFIAVTNAQALPLSLFLSKTKYPLGERTQLRTGETLFCAWTNGGWKRTQSPGK